MLVNRAIERARELGLKSWLQRRRSSLVEGRTPVVVVPPFLGTKLVDDRGRVIWGQTRRLFFGPRLAGMKGLKTAGPLEELPIIPGVVGQDILGGLLRFLARRGGFVRGEDLFVLEYDFREGVAHAAAELAKLVARVRGAGDDRVDLVCVSSGGAIGRYFMAYGGTDARGSDDHDGARGPSPSADPAELVRRVVYVGAPHRGTFGALAQIHEGVVMVPGGRLFPARDMATCQTLFDFLPRPSDPVFVDTSGRALDLDLYKAETWRELGLAGGLDGVDPLDFQAKLSLGARLHGALERASAPHPDTIVIGARHEQTRARVLVTRGRAVMPDCDPRPSDPYARYVYEPGDGTLPFASLLGAPGFADASDERLWLVTPKAHHLMPADPDVHRMILEALLATDRRLPEARARVTVRSASSLVRSTRA